MCLLAINAYDLHGEFPKIVGKPHIIGFYLQTDVCVEFVGSINPIKSAFRIFVSVQITAHQKMLFLGRKFTSVDINIFDPQKALPCMRPDVLVYSARLVLGWVTVQGSTKPLGQLSLLPSGDGK